MSPDEWPVMILLFRLAAEGMQVIPLSVVGAGLVAKYKTGKYYYGEDIPDIGFLHVDVRNLPILEISDCNFAEGMDVAVAGFPMGTDTLKAPGWVHQFSPTLTKGIISSVLPFPCKGPHALLLDLMSQGGSSGSPVFDVNNGEIVGMIYAGLQDIWSFGGNSGMMHYKVPTNLSLALPSNLLRLVIGTFDTIPEIKNRDLSKIPTLEESIATRESVVKFGERNHGEALRSYSILFFDKSIL